MTCSILYLLLQDALISLSSQSDIVGRIGTGTPVGDPIEVNAIGRFFEQRGGPPLLIGSVSIASTKLIPSTSPLLHVLPTMSRLRN